MQPESTVEQQLSSCVAAEQTVPLGDSAEKQVQTERIDGYDVARAIAVAGMILTNFHSIFMSGRSQPLWFMNLVDFFYGRAAALFVMLAGVGLALLSRNAVTSCNKIKVRHVRLKLLKRSLVLFLLGGLFLRWWRADILHFYGVYLLTGACLLTFTARRLWGLVLTLWSVATLLFCLYDGLPASGILFGDGVLADIVDDLFLNGCYPVFPWMVFLLIGMWLAREGILTDASKMRRVLIWAVATAVSVELCSRLLLPWTAAKGVDDTVFPGILLIINFSPISPLFVISAAATSIIIILLAMNLPRFKWTAWSIKPLCSAGKLSLTIYITHVFFGLALCWLLEIKFGKYFSPFGLLLFCLFFSLLVIWGSFKWSQKFRCGPFEWLLRRFSGS